MNLEASSNQQFTGTPSASPSASTLRQRIDRDLAAQEERFERLVERMQRRRILSTLPYPRVDFWYENLDTVLPKGRRLWDLMRRPFDILDPLIIPRLLRLTHRYDIVFVSGGERADLLYLALAGLCPWIRTPHVIVDAHWQKDRGLLLLLQRLILRLGSRLTVQVQPHSPEEIEIYHHNFRIPREKFSVVPWSTSLIGYSAEPRDGDFVLTGGLSYRDYDTFFRAMRQLDIPVEVGLPSGHNGSGLELARGAANITLHTSLTEQQYVEKIASCRVLAMPITPGLERSTADRTILNAMHMRKVVVATDSIGSRIYIRHGENGFLVPPGDADSWRDAIARVFAMGAQEYQAMADQAEYDARVVFNEPMRLYRTMKAGLDAIGA